MKQVLLKLMSAMTIVLISACLTPAKGNGTVKKEDCAPKHKKRHKKHHHQPAIEEPCYVEPACPTAVLPCNELYYPPCEFYAGGQFGYLNMRSKFKNILIPTGIIDAGMKTDNGVIGELLGGFRHFWPSGVNLGFDLALNMESTDVKRPLFPGTLLKVKLKRKFSIVPAITVGRVFQCRWNFFAKLGLGISNFESKVNVVANGRGFKSTKTKLGVVPSMGLEYAINEYLSAIGTLTYEYYDKVPVTFTNVLVTGDNDRQVPRRIQYVAAKAGFIAKF
jgi:hypothetical protein